MADSSFITGMNAANTAFGAAASEKFKVMKTGNLGEYDAISIDDLTSATSVTAGGLRGDNTVAVWVSREILTSSGAVQGSILEVRNKRVRVAAVSDEGDNTLMLQCTGAGVSL